MAAERPVEPIVEVAEEEVPDEGAYQAVLAEEVKEVAAADDDQSSRANGVNIIPGWVIIKDRHGNELTRIDDVRYRNEIRIYC